MVGVDGRERDGVASGVGARLGVDADDGVVDIEMTDRRRSSADVTGAGEGGPRAWMSQSAEQKRRGEGGAEQQSLAVGVSQAWGKAGAQARAGIERRPRLTAWRHERRRRKPCICPRTRPSRPSLGHPLLIIVMKIAELAVACPPQLLRSRAPPTLPVPAAIGHNPLDARATATRAGVGPAERLWRAVANLLGTAADRLFPHRMLSYRP